MRYSKNKRNHKKRRTRTRSAGNLINNTLGKVKSDLTDTLGKVKSGLTDTLGKAESGLTDTLGKAESSLRNEVSSVEGEVKNQAQNIQTGGRKTKKCRQRGGNTIAETMSKLSEQTAGWKENLGHLKNALQGGIKKAEELTPTLQNGGKRKKKLYTKGGQNNEIFENKNQINEATANKVEEQVPVNKVEDELPVKKQQPEVTMDNTEKLPEAEVEKECTGFLDKIFGCKTKAQKQQESKLNECIANCKAPKKSETKQQGGKTKKLKKRKKRNSRKKKISRKR